jgi:LPXTG-motif cell wall-anchored protein
MLQLLALIGFLILAASSALAQTIPGSPPATGPAGTGQTGEITDSWWVLLLVLVVAAVIWYFSSRRTRV